jgi:hypothetical protein
MNAYRGVCAAVLLTLSAGAAAGQPAPMKPPMNDFDQAFYRCDGGEAFMMTYDADEPTKAEMVTNSDQRHYQLKRGEAKAGVQFSGGGAKFWTDGKSVVGETPKGAFKNCKIKSS